MARSRQPGGREALRKLSDRLVFEVAKRWLADDASVMEIAEWLVDEHADELPWLTTPIPPELLLKSIEAMRQKVYDIVREAARREFIRQIPPQHVTYADQVWHRFHIDDKKRKIEVVNAHDPGSLDEVADVAAECTLRLIRNVAEHKPRVHIALGAGRTGLAVARRLGELVVSEPDFPQLALHALTSGFLVDNPLTAPVTFFRFFDQDRIDIEFIGLFAAAFERYETYEAVKDRPGIRESFDRAAEVDIVITSLARAGHAHGLLNQVLAKDADTAEQLRRRDWVGDVQFLPFSRESPLVLKKGLRAVTLFEFDDLVRMANTDGKYVVLVAGPCNSNNCGDRKTEALAPLLAKPHLRVWSHLVTDIRTAGELLGNSTDSPLLPP